MAFMTECTTVESFSLGNCILSHGPDSGDLAYVLAMEPHFFNVRGNVIFPERSFGNESFPILDQQIDVIALAKNTWYSPAILTGSVDGCFFLGFFFGDGATFSVFSSTSLSTSTYFTGFFLDLKKM